MNFRPTQDWVVFEVPVVDNKTKGGIIKSPTQIKQEEEERKSLFLKVLAIGVDCTKVKVGDLVMMEGGAKETIIDGVKYGIVREYNIVLIKDE
jgi:co-chaperonin GroES (HSP10)